ncbi:MAG: ATP-binding cassette domain-containing protein, partial [Lentisphaeria bacterium]|nr:ATP-binding cassette domain-containing protein [Lentisphaeria bacterium]
RPKKKAKEQALALLERVGLAHRVLHRSGELSGGEQQRAAIARALINSPRLLLADEPTGNLDSVTGSGILDLFKEIHADGMTIVMVTHDRYVAGLADRTVELKDGLLA